MSPSAPAAHSRHVLWIYGLSIALLVLHMPAFGIMGTREEMHFTQALRWMEPARFGPLSASWENPPAWLGFNAVAGPMVVHLTGENAQRAGRLLGAVVNGAALAALAVALGVTVVELLAVLPFFILALQEILGQEWLYVSFEPKVLAYPFVVLALERLLRRRPLQAGACLALAGVFHPVIALQWLALLGIFQAWDRRSPGESLRFGGGFAALFGPFAATVLWPWLAQTVSHASLRGVDGRTASWIYSFVIDPTHVAPFKDLGELSRWDQGIGLCLGLFLAALGMLRTSSGQVKTLARLCVAVLGWLLLAVAASAVDRAFLNGVLGQLTLFRPSSLGLLLFLLTLALFLRQANETLGRRLALGAACIVLPIFVPHIAQDWLEPIKDQRKAEVRQAAVMEHLTTHTASNATLLLHPALDDAFQHLERTTGRATLVNRRITPTAPADILEWRARSLWREEVFDKGCPALANATYPMEYLLVPKDECGWARLDACARRAFEDERFVLYRLGD